MAHEATANTNFKLPNEIISPADVSRLRRELEAVTDFLDQAAIRQPGTSLNLPQTSRLLEDLAASNKLNLLQTADRHQASAFLASLQAAPVINISFANDPSAAFVGKIITWLRANIHPLLLLRIGLEPAIAAGCVVRTNSKQFDFSLRRHFTSQNQMLIKLLVDNAAENTA